MRIRISAKKRYGLLVCLFPITSLFAQTTADSLSLREAITLTLARYPAVKAKQQLVKAGEANLTDVRHNWYPVLKLHDQVDVGTDNSIYGSYFTMGLIPSTSGGIRNENVSSLMSGNIAMANVQWEIYNFGAYGSQREDARRALEVNHADLGNTANQLTVNVIETYLQLLRLHELINIQADNVKRNAEIVHAVTTVVLHGLKPGVDSTIAVAELSKARLNLLDVSNHYNQARIQLATLTGLDTSQVTPEWNTGGRLMAMLNSDSSSTVADNTHPLLQYYDALFRRQQVQELIVRKQSLPKLSLMAAGWMRGSSGSFNDYYDKNLFSGLGYNRYNYLLGLGVTWNITDQRRRHERLAVQQYRSAAASQELETLRVVLHNMYEQAQNDILTSKAKLNELPLQLQAARAAARQKTSLYKGGLANIIDVTNALFVLNRAETDLVEARTAAWVALFRAAYASNNIAAFSLQ
ncbi:MAG TPA: TolC family protein [Chitinophaga sp.]|uniref:TolC family protein n=1 Tax=Chitinophaga sp. TaxID=1869181 RepID=UPI002C03617C|nr:TolC family protein [Chitinophaga sp.]HVI48548.1 TolC family protein [Chitinophaga sp.]